MCLPWEHGEDWRVIGKLRCAQAVCATCFSAAHRGAGEAEAFGLRAAAADMTPKQLKEHLTFPQTWGPTEWGPISFLPDHDILVSAPAASKQRSHHQSTLHQRMAGRHGWMHGCPGWQKCHDLYWLSGTEEAQTC